jgi:hypothetical protein
MKKIKRQLNLLAILALLGVNLPALAEPYLAVRTAQACSGCHVNPSGGGKRNAAGVAYGQHVLPARFADNPWDGRVNPYLALGGDLRFSATFTDRAQGSDESDFATDRASLYMEVNALPELTFYLDQQMTPTSSNREAYMLWWLKDNNVYLKSGRLFLPYGLRLEDDSAYIRDVSGINFSGADNGVEVGTANGPWILQAALSNGSNGGAENNRGKQLSLRAEHLIGNWRFGASFNDNDGSGNQDRTMYNLFVAGRWLGMEWLAEVDQIQDTGTNIGDVDRQASLLEINRELIKGHNLKLTLEFYDPNQDIDEDEQNRYSLLWEYTPMSMLQLRAGLRMAEGIPQAVDDQNDDLLFVQLHSWF